LPTLTLRQLVYRFATMFYKLALREHLKLPSLSITQVFTAISMACNQPHQNRGSELPDISTAFVPPTPIPFPCVIIEFCDRVSLSVRRSSIPFILQLSMSNHDIRHLNINAASSAAGKQLMPSLRFLSCSALHIFDYIIFGVPIIRRATPRLQAPPRNMGIN
jgi:hypothetical protein